MRLCDLSDGLASLWRRPVTLSIYLTGLMMGLSLIVAIGAQNAFLLRQGLIGQHVLAVCLACALSDAILILLGVTALGAVSALLSPGLIRPCGSAARPSCWSMRRAASSPPSVPMLPCGSPRHRRPAGNHARHLPRHHLAQSACLSRHGRADRHHRHPFPGAEYSFAAGAITGSTLFFFSFGYGARLLRPLFARPLAWRVLDGLIAFTMTAIAVQLLWAVLRGRLRLRVRPRGRGARGRR